MVFRVGWNGSLSERFERYYIPEPNSGCWLWLSSLAGRGRRRATIYMNGRYVYASHVSWLLYKNSPLPKGALVLHTCDMPECVNPDHLWLGSQLDNIRDCMKKGRYKAPPASIFFGEEHPRSKLTTANILQIRTGKLSNDGYAKKFGIHVRHVRAIKAKTKWKHLL